MNNLSYSEFICPHCGKRHDISDAVVVDEITDTKSAGSTISGRNVVHKFIDTHYKVRFCPKCAKKRENAKKWRSRIFWKIAPLGFCAFTVCGMIAKGEVDSIGSFIGVLLMGLFFGYLASVVLVAIPVGIIFKLYLDIDVDEAAKGNALKNPFL